MNSIHEIYRFRLHAGEKWLLALLVGLCATNADSTGSVAHTQDVHRVLPASNVTAIFSNPKNVRVRLQPGAHTVVFYSK